MLLKNPYLGFLILILIFTQINCKGSLEQKYNPKTFSDDIEELNKNDRIIIKNIISAYEKNNDLNSIAGSETILIPSLTFKELKNNYTTFHLTWRASIISSIKETLKNRWSHDFSPPILIDFLNNNLKILLNSQRVRDPQNQFISRELVITNNFKKPIRFTNSIQTSKKLTDQHYLHIYNIPLLEMGQSHVQIINDIDFRDGHKPTSDETLKITDINIQSNPDNLSDSVLTIGEKNYTLNDLNFINDFGRDSLNVKLKNRLSKVDSLVDKKFKLTVWPYDNSNARQMKEQILKNERFHIDSK